MNYTERSLKITVVGDGTVGKTCLLHVFQKKKFPTDYVPTVMDEYQASVVIGHKCYSITLWDTAGQEDYDRLRPLAYPNTDVFIMCYAVDNKTTFENIFVKWIIEIKSYCPNAAILIVGTKLDKRGNGCNGKTCECATDNKHVLLHEAQMLAKKNKCSQVIECSALTGENVQEVFQEAVKAALKINTQNNRFCCLLS